MNTYPRRTNRSSRGSVLITPLAFAFRLMLLLGSLFSPLVVSAADIRIDQQVMNLAQQPVRSANLESATASADTNATAQSTPLATPNAEGTTVTILSWECVPGTLSGQPMSYYQGEHQCEGEKIDVVFDVDDDNGNRQATSVEDGRLIDNLMGQVTITEILPDDYETPAIFCTSLTGQPGQAITGSDGSVTLSPGTGDEYECSFYNIPSGVSATGTGDVLVYTYACPSTPPPNSEYAWYFQNCATRQNGATFVLDTPNADIESNAGDSLNGAVTMRGLQVGVYPLTETAAVPNHEIGAVFCAEIGKTELPGPAQMMPQPVSGDTITAPVTADKLFYCHWYQVPTASASPAD